MLSKLIRALTVGLVALSAQVANGQTAPPQAQPTTGFQDGFFIQSADGDYRLVFGMVAQADGRFSIDDPSPITDTFTLRKFRPTLTGQLTRFFTFKLMPDLGGGSTSVPDAYLEMRLSPAFRIRTGKDKTPVGYELLQADAYLWFMERSLASSLVPNRDIGVQVLGDLAQTRLSYSVGVFNGVPDGASSTTELDTGDAKDVAGRVLIAPFRTMKDSPLRELGVHIGASAGKQTGPLPAFRTSAGQTYFSYLSAATAAGTRTRLSPAVFYYFKSFGAFGEYMQSTQTVARAERVTEVSNHAWQASASVMLTGDAVAYGAIRPRSPFNPAEGRWGAVQLLARYSELTVDQNVFDAGLAGATASREAHTLAGALNWFPNANVKYYATFEHTTFEGGALSRPPENVILFRAQLNF